MLIVCDAVERPRERTMPALDSAAESAAAAHQLGLDGEPLALEAQQAAGAVATRHGAV